MVTEIQPALGSPCSRREPALGNAVL